MKDKYTGWSGSFYNGNSAMPIIIKDGDKDKIVAMFRDIENRDHVLACIDAPKGLGLSEGWMRVLDLAHNEMLIAYVHRGTNMGILVNDDLWALKYQVAEYKYQRACFSLTGGRNIAYIQLLRRGAIRARQKLAKLDAQGRNDWVDPKEGAE